MDAFFASVEQRDDPSLRGRPVVVGGRPDSRGVVAAASYEARQFGIHSAMSCSRAYRKCPQTAFVKPRFEAYKKISQQIRQIFHQYSDLVEPLSLDEAYIDVTQNKVGQSSATIIAQEIREKILDTTGLTASAGVSYNKFLAKIASDVNKPNGIKIILPKEGASFVAELPIGRFYGVGTVTEKKMKKLGIHSGAELRAQSRYFLSQHFGNSGSYFYDVSRGVDTRDVKVSRGIRRTMSNESTFSTDISDIDQLLEQIERLSRKIADDCCKKDQYGKTITVKVKYADFQQVTRSQTFQQIVREYEQIYSVSKKLLLSTEAGSRKIRLLGVGISSFEEKQQQDESMMQMDLDLELITTTDLEKKGFL